MTVIETQRTITEHISIPNCFCGKEPEVRTRRALGDDRYKQILWIECPHCRACSPISRAFRLDSVNSRYEATKSVANAWYEMIVRYKD